MVLLMFIIRINKINLKSGGENKANNNKNENNLNDCMRKNIVTDKNLNGDI